MARHGRPQSSLAGERHRLLRGPGSGCTPSAGKGGGGLEAVAERVAFLIEDSTLLAREGPHGPCGGLGGPQGGLDREVACSAVLEGEKY